MKGHAALLLPYRDSIAFILPQVIGCQAAVGLISCFYFRLLRDSCLSLIHDKEAFLPLLDKMSKPQRRAGILKPQFLLPRFFGRTDSFHRRHPAGQ